MTPHQRSLRQARLEGKPVTKRASENGGDWISRKQVKDLLVQFIMTEQEGKKQKKLGSLHLGPTTAASKPQRVDTEASDLAPEV